MTTYETVLDLGSKYVRAGLVSDGFFVTVPAVVATVDGRTVAVGESALTAKGAGVKLSRPILEGTIIDNMCAKALFKYVFDKILPESNAFSTFNVKCVMPCVTSSLDKAGVETVILSLGAREVSFVEAPIACSRELFKQFHANAGLIVDVGHDSADLAVVAGGEIVSGVTLYHAGKHLGEAIGEKIAAKYLVELDESQLELVKRNAVSLYANDVSSVNVYGTNTKSGRVENITVTAKELYDTAVDYARKYVEVAHGLLSSVSTEVAVAVKQSGVMLCGGGANLSGLDLLLSRELGVTVRIAKNPSEVAVCGALRLGL